MSCTVTGANLPATGLALAAAGCSNSQQAAGLTASQAVLTCVPAAPGALAVNVTLNGATLGGTTVTVPTSAQIAQTFLTALDALFATAIPANGAARYVQTDGCSLNNGYTKANAIAAYDANVDPSNGSDSYKQRIGSTESNVTVLAERAIVNADKTTRRELDIQYQVNYADGTVATGQTNTLIYGSSSGSVLPGGPCTTPDVQTAWRSYGDRAVVNYAVDGQNTRSEFLSITTGADLTPAKTYGKGIRLRVADPGGYANYAIVSGPGIINTTTGAPMSLKLISPRLLRSDPLLAGKPGNAVNYADYDNFNACRTSAGAFADAATADCAQFGATGNEWGPANSASGATVDTAFATYGFVAGGVYTFKLYNDDGWKTVNGQATMTPIATYTATLNRLPYSAATLQGSANDLFPQADNGSFASGAPLTEAAFASAITGMGAVSINIGWTAPGAMPDAVKFSHRLDFIFAQGNTAATGANGWPKVRQIAYSYPGASATTSTYSLPAATSAMVNRNSGQVAAWYTDRNGSFLKSYLVFQ